MNEMIQGIPGNEDTVIGGDMNGYIVGSEKRRYKRIHGCYSFRKKLRWGKSLRFCVIIM